MIYETFSSRSAANFTRLLEPYRFYQTAQVGDSLRISDYNASRFCEGQKAEDRSGSQKTFRWASGDALRLLHLYGWKSSFPRKSPQIWRSLKVTSVSSYNSDTKRPVP